MRLISWNVAGFRACLKKGFSDFFDWIDADVFCLQEVKATEDQISFHPFGYRCYLYPAERKGYSGTLVYSKIEPLSICYGVGIEEYDHEGRVITLEFEQFYLVNVYVPNVKRTLERLLYRMEWEDMFRKYLKRLEEKKPIVVCGDFNVAHTEKDIRNAKANIGNAGFTEEEREKFSCLLDSGFIDIYRYFNPNVIEKYTWWSYMPGVRERNIGWRIDYFLCSKQIIDRVKKVNIYHEILGSDHCPIGLDIEMK